MKRAQSRQSQTHQRTARRKAENNALERIFAQDAIETTHDYLGRGRQLEHLDTEALRQHWITAFEAWWRDRTREAMRGYKDAEAELGLRGAAPPHGMISPEIRVAMQAEVAREVDNPETFERVAARIRELLSKEGSRH